jgi:hypothetical protein
VTSFLSRKRDRVPLNTDQVLCRMPMLTFNNGFRGCIIQNCKIPSLNFEPILRMAYECYPFFFFCADALSCKCRENCPRRSLDY